MKKKLLIFHATVPTYRIDLFNKLVEFFDVKLVAYGKKENIEKLGFDYKQVLEEAKFIYTVYDKGMYFGNNHLISSMYYHEIQSFKPDIVFCQELGINTLVSIMLKKLFKYKIIINCDDSPDMLNNYSPLRKLLRKFVYNRINGIIVVNAVVEKILKKKFSYCSFFYFPIIQDENKFRNNLESSKALSYVLVKTFNLDKKIVFLFVGRLIEEKQPMMLLEAFKEAKVSNSILVMIGNGHLANSINDYVQKENLSDKVLLMGKLHGNDLYAWYRVADYFVLPSIFEPFGAVVNEALISGCKVIVGDKVGANTLINLSNGIIFNSNDKNNLISILKESHYKKKSIENQTPILFNDLSIELYSFISKL